jgi:hypothetical protein
LASILHDTYLARLDLKPFHEERLNGTGLLFGWRLLSDAAQEDVHTYLRSAFAADTGTIDTFLDWMAPGEMIDQYDNFKLLFDMSELRKIVLLERDKLQSRFVDDFLKRSQTVDAPPAPPREDDLHNSEG